MTFLHKTKEKTLLEVEIDHVMSSMTNLDPVSKEYEDASKNLERLYKLKLEEDAKKAKIEPSDLIGALTNLLDIGFIMNHERLHVLTTKALGFIRKKF